jgi:predicted RNase H-like nuclease (RuvC/YqgF family)
MTMHNSIPSVAPDGTRRVTGEATVRVDAKPIRFSAQQKTEIVLRLLRGESIDLLSRECGVPSSRIAAWRDTFLEAGQESMKKRPALERDRELSRLREKLGESTMDIELLHEKIDRLESGRPLGPRRSRR